jgi:hypothetical protein
MKIVMQNYANQHSTEALYLTECFNISGIETTLWHTEQLSAFDVLDVADPDVVVCSLSKISLDIFKAISGTKREMIVNVTGASQKDIDLLEKAMDKNSIKCPMLFGRESEGTFKSKIKYTSVLSGADVFLKNLKNVIPDYRINTLYIVDSNQEIDDKEPHHIVSTNEGVKCDMVIPVNALYKVCQNYNKVVIKQSLVDIPQSVFDTIFYSDNVSIESSGDNSEQVQKSIASIFGDAPKKSILQHVCTRRASRFLQKIGCKEQADRARKIDINSIFGE